MVPPDANACVDNIMVMVCLLGYSVPLLHGSSILGYIYVRVRFLLLTFPQLIIKPLNQLATCNDIASLSFRVSESLQIL